MEALVTRMSTFPYTNDDVLGQTMALLSGIFSIILQVPQFIILWSLRLVVGQMPRGTMLACICILLFRLCCNHQLSGTSWLLCLVSNFGFGLFLMIFLAKGQDAGIRFCATCCLIGRAVWFTTSIWARMILLLWYHYCSMSSLHVLGLSASFLLFLLLFERGGSL